MKVWQGLMQGMDSCMDRQDGKLDKGFYDLWSKNVVF